MTPPHGLFKYLFHRHMSLHSCHSQNLSETPSTNAVSRVPQAHSLDQPQPTTVGGSDKALQKPEVLQVDCGDCAMSSSVSSQSSHGQTTQVIATSFEGRGLGLGAAGIFAPGGDRHSNSSLSISPSVRHSFSSNISPTSSTSTPSHDSHMLTATSSASTTRTPSASFKSSTRSHTSSGIGSYSKTRHMSTVSIPSAFVTTSVPTSLEVTSTSIPLLTTTNANNETTTSSPTSRVASTAPLTSIGVEYQTVSLPYASMSASQSVSCALCSVSSLVVIHPSLLSAHVPVPSITLTTTPFTTISSTTVHSTVQSSSPAGSQSSSNLDTMSNPQMGAITGGAIGGVALVGFLIFLVMRHRSRKMLYVTPYDIHSTERLPITRSRNLKYRTSARRPDSARTSESSFVQYSDAHLVEFESASRRSPSSSVDPAVSFMSTSDEDNRHALASILARRHRTYDLEKIYPSRMRTTNRFDSGDHWVEQVVTGDPSRDPSEELPAYPRSMKSSKSTSREADRGDDNHDDHFVLPSSYPPLPE